MLLELNDPVSVEKSDFGHPKRYPAAFATQERLTCEPVGVAE